MKNRLQKIKRNFREISEQLNQPYQNFILDHINDHCLRIAVMENEYPWHYHAKTDELFMVLEGELQIEKIKNEETIRLKPGEFITIPAKTIHKTSAKTRTVNLTFERNAIDTVFVDPF